MFGSTNKLIAALVVVLGLMGAGCSSAESEVVADILLEDESTAAELPVDDGSADDDGEDDAISDEPVEEPSEEPGPDPVEEELPTGDADSEFCIAAAEVDVALDEFGSGGVPPAAELEAGLDEIRQKMSRSIDLAPPDIKRAVELSTEGFDALAAEFEKVGYEFLDVDIPTMDAIDSNPVYEEGRFQVQTYLFEVCGVGDGPPEPSDDDDLDEFDEETGTLREQIIGTLTALGFTEVEATCLSELEGLAELLQASEEEINATFAQCDIPPERIEELFGA